MKQGNSESDQTPDFVCFRKVVYVQRRNPEFCMFLKKMKIAEKKKSNFRGNSDFREKKESDFREKKVGFPRKKFGISFPPECFITKLKKKKVNGHGAIVSSSPCICRRNYISDESIEHRISSIEPNSGIDKYRRNQVSNQH